MIISILYGDSEKCEPGLPKDDSLSLYPLMPLVSMVSVKEFWGIKTEDDRYVAGGYHDDNAAQFQKESALFLNGRSGFTLFAAAGQGWHYFEIMNLNYPRWSGKRFMAILKQADTNQHQYENGLG